MDFMLVLLLISNLFAVTNIAPEHFDGLLQKAPRLKALAFENEAAQARRVSRLSLFAPTLHARAGIEKFSIGNLNNRTQGYGSVEARLNVFKSGQDHAQFKEFSLNAKRIEEETKAQVGDELARLYELYYEAKATQKKITILESALETNRRHLGMANRRLKAGLVTNTDLLDFNIYELKVQEQLIKEELTLKEIEILTRTLLGLDQNEKISWKSSSFRHPVELTGAGERTEKIMQYALDATENSTYQKQSWWKPKVDLVASFAQLTQREEDYIFAKDRQEKVLALELTFDLDFGASPWSEAAESRLSEQALAQTMRQQLLSVRENVTFIDEAQRLYTDQLKKVEAHAEIAKIHLKQTLEEYARGVKNAPDVLGASERVTESEIELIDANLALNKILAQKLRLSQL